MNLSLTSYEWASFLETSKNDLVEDFFAPALSRSIKYDRGVGFFTSGWLRENAKGMSLFAEHGGKARWITSPILEAKDWEALIKGTNAGAEPALRDALFREIESLESALEKDTLNALAWMVSDGVIEFKLAVPVNSLSGGEFHDKFGIFTDHSGLRLSFNGSYNDSIQGLRNYESIKIFRSWVPGVKEWVSADQARFDSLWSNQDPNLKVYTLPEAVRKKIQKLRSGKRPYRYPRQIDEEHRNISYGLWPHQEEALGAFLDAEHGVVEMATGTGKTRLGLAICHLLVSQNKLRTIIVSADGTDLLDQWYKSLLTLISKIETPWAIYRHYGSHKEADNFLLEPCNSIILVSRYFLGPVLKNFDSEYEDKAILIHDEVHRMGSPANRKSLTGLSKKIRYRIGLSATPDREYDQEGNDFIRDELGGVIYQFGLAEAISSGILAPFNYYPIFYTPSEEDKRKVQAVYAMKAARQREGRPMSKEEVWTEIAKVYKTSKAKLNPFRDFISKHPEMLKRCVIFVETIDYGHDVLAIVHSHSHEFHTYFAEEDSEVLQRFSEGEIECLLTCHRLSEGIDIQSLSTVILFSSSRAKLETIQRIGRCLRIDPSKKGKVSCIIDFVRNDVEDSSDHERAEWLSELSKIRPVL